MGNKCFSSSWKREREWKVFLWRQFFMLRCRHNFLLFFVNAEHNLHICMNPNSILPFFIHPLACLLTSSLIQRKHINQIGWIMYKHREHIKRRKPLWQIVCCAVCTKSSVSPLKMTFESERVRNVCLLNSQNRERLSCCKRKGSKWGGLKLPSKIPTSFLFQHRLKSEQQFKTRRKNVQSEANNKKNGKRTQKIICLCNHCRQRFPLLTCTCLLLLFIFHLWHTSFSLSSSSSKANFWCLSVERDG